LIVYGPGLVAVREQIYNVSEAYINKYTYIQLTVSSIFICIKYENIKIRRISRRFMSIVNKAPVIVAMVVIIATAPVAATTTFSNPESGQVTENKPATRDDLAGSTTGPSDSTLSATNTVSYDDFSAYIIIHEKERPQGGTVLINVTLHNIPEDASSAAVDLEIPYNWSVNSSSKSLNDRYQALWKNPGSEITLSVVLNIPGDTQTGEHVIYADTNVYNGTPYWDNESDSVWVYESHHGTSSSTNSASNTNDTSEPKATIFVPPRAFDSNYNGNIGLTEIQDGINAWSNGLLWVPNGYPWGVPSLVSIQAAINAWADNSELVYTDVDGDGLTSREEYHLGTHPFDSNPDNDHFSDLTDPRPSTEDIAPNINVTYPDGFFSGSPTVEAKDQTELYVLKWAARLDTGTVDEFKRYPDSNSKVISAPENSGLDNFTVTAEDEHGNEHVVRIDVKDNGSAEIIRSEVSVAGLPAVGGATSIGAGAFGAAGLALGFAVVSVGAVVKNLVTTTTETGSTETIEGPLQSSPTVSEYSSLASSVDSAVAASSVVLTEGFVESTDDPDGGTLYRGYGQELLQAATSVTKSRIEHLLTTETAIENIYENGDRTVVIGDNGLGKTIAITIIGGVVQAASENTIPTGEVTDGTQDCREVKYDDRSGEGIRDHVINNDKKPIDSLDLFELVISDPSSVG